MAEHRGDLGVRDERRRRDEPVGLPEPDPVGTRCPSGPTSSRSSSSVPGIVIGQACEFDYSGTQACRVLGQEGYRVVLANSNPATIMTDPDFADRTYLEPLTPDVLERIIERERPDAVLPTLGGQTGLNLAMALHERGVVGGPGRSGAHRRQRRCHRHRRGP